MTTTLETRISGSRRSRFLQELFGNSWHFPIANILLEFLLEGPAAFLSDPALYSILTAGMVQAYFLSRWQESRHPRRFLGNLIGVGIYTLVEMALEEGFFQSPNHLAYWSFSILIGLVQTLRYSRADRLSDLSTVLEDLVRISIIPAMYLVFEMKENPGQTAGIMSFFSDPSHLYITLLALLLGLNIGLSSLTAKRFLALLRQTSNQLKTYSEWLLGRDLLGQMIDDPSALTLRRQDRVILFMDIRNFTAWSEQRPPEEVVTLLNRFYQVGEAILNQHNPIKFKFAGDEVLAIFYNVDDGVQAALKLQRQVASVLGRQGLGAGIGLHLGAIVEGLLGGKDVKFYDVVGDTVNTTKRIESCAGPGEVLISEAVRLAIGASFRSGPKRQITVKGKEDPLTVYPLE